MRESFQTASQYDTLAFNMRNALPKAVFIGFTGMPLMAGEERTKEVFGDYVNIYNFRQSIEDGATVPMTATKSLPIAAYNINTLPGEGQLLAD